MTTIHADLTKAFDVPIKQFGIDNSIIVTLENIDAPTSTDTPFLNGTMLPAPVEQADLGHSEFREGIYQIDIRNRS